MKLDVRTGANVSISTFRDSLAPNTVIAGPITLEDEEDRDEVVSELEEGINVDYECVNKVHQEEYLGCYHHEWNHVLPNITWIGEENSPAR